MHPLLDLPAHCPPLPVTSEPRAELAALYGRFSLAALLHVAVNIRQSQSPDSSHPPLHPRVHMSTLYVCVSIPALQTGSPVPFFLEPTYMH